jgi:predicted transcriptional regulator
MLGLLPPQITRQSLCVIKFLDILNLCVTNNIHSSAYEVRPDSDDEEDFSVISEDDVNLSQCVPYSPNPEILQYWKSWFVSDT